MNKEHETVGSLALDQAPRVISIPAVSQEQTRKLRVAAYARVSSDSEDQLHSFAAQTARYTELILQNPDWELVDVYADKGITGTSTEKREDFQRMLTDCRRGRIDKILVKSSSRFARNTKESLETVRELKNLGIAVCFEEENIDTSELSGELLTAIFAMLAQKESEVISDNLKWSIDKRMREGKYNTCNAPFGYRLNRGALEPVPEEAAIVKYIYQAYLTGKTSRDIARALNIFDKERSWKAQRIDYILTNERYCGNALLRKRYSTNTFPHRMRRNHGEQPMYYVKDINDAIITKEEFDCAKNLRKKRASYNRPGSAGERPFANKWLQCGVCGKSLRPKCVSGKWYMVCRGHEETLDDCELPPISEETILVAILRLYFKLRHHGINILRQLIKDLQAAKEARLLWSIDIVRLNERIADIVNQDRLLTQLKKQGLVDPDLFISRRDRLAEQLRTTKLEKERILEAEEDQTIQQTLDILNILESGPDLLDEFDGELFSELVEKIVVESADRLRFRLTNELELTEQMERSVR